MKPRGHVEPETFPTRVQLVSRRRDTDLINIEGNYHVHELPHALQNVSRQTYVFYIYISVVEVVKEQPHMGTTENVLPRN